MILLAKYFLTFIFLQNTSIADGHGLTQEDKKEILQKHNDYRSELSIDALEWDEDLADYAYEWALVIKEKCNLRHRPYRGKYKLIYGENIAISHNDNATEAVELWASEKKDFNPRTMRTYRSYYLNKVGHYTQIIWRKTTRVGCARVQCEGGSYITVCNYDPPGNYVDQKIY